MPKLRVISGKKIVQILLAEGFVKIRQKGSHTRLVIKIENIFYYITVPLHEELDKGTLKSIIKSLRRCFSEEKLVELFYIKNNN